MLGGSTTIVRIALTLAAAAGILVHPSHESARIAKARNTQRPAAQQRNEKDAQRSKPAPQPVTPVAVLSPDTGLTKPSAHAKSCGEVLAASVRPGALTSAVSLHSMLHPMPDAPTGRLHRPTHFAQAPPAA